MHKRVLNRFAMQGRSGKVQISANVQPIIHTANRGQAFANRVQETFYPSQTLDMGVNLSMTSDMLGHLGSRNPQKPQNFEQNLAQA